MIQGIIKFSISNKLLVALFTVAIIIGGIWSMTKVPIDAVPDITNNQVQVITQAPNLSTEDIEQFITLPVELALANLPGVTEIRSISRFGLSAVTIVFEDKMGTYLPRQLVAEKIDQINDEIPENFGNTFMGPITTGLGEIYQYSLEVHPNHTDNYSLYDLRTIQDWIIKRQMAMVPGVIEVNSFGGAVKQYEVAVDPHELNARNITIQEVFTALENNNGNTGGAYLQFDHRANFIRGEGLIKELVDIENIVVKNIDNTPVLIKDLAEVGYGNGVRYGAFTKNGQGESVGGIILMLKGENSNSIIRNVKERMEAIERSLPEGIEIKPFLDRSELISQTTTTVTTNLSEGALIVIFVLVFLLGNWRGGLIVASTIPLSLLFAFILMNVFDVWANLMSLGAIDFGIIVDGAVIIVEGTVFLFHEKLVKKELLNTKARDGIAFEASKKMMNAAFFGQLVILIVFLPILALEGIEGKMFRPMALTFMFAMIGVMILCLTYVPMMSAWFLRPTSTKKSWGDLMVKAIESRYESILNRAFRFGRWIIAIAILLFAGSLFTFSQLGGEFIPRLDEGDIAFHDLLKPGSSLNEAIKVTTAVEETLLAEFPEVKEVYSRIGVSDVPIDLMPMDAADCFIKLNPEAEWNAANKAVLIENIKKRLEEIPGVNYEFTQPIEMRFNELMTGIRQDVAVKIYGDNLDILASKASEVARLIEGIEGVGDLRVEATEGQPQIAITYDRKKLAFYGISIHKLNSLVKTAFAGTKAGTVFEAEKRFDLVLRLDEQYRNDLSDVRNLLVDLSSGVQVPLQELATIRFERGPMQISRDNTNRRTYVGINVRGRDVKTLITDIENVLSENLELPPGYYIRFGGAFENLERATKRLWLVVPLALALIFILVFMALGSVSQTLMIYIAIPFAAIGGVISLYVRSMPFSISAGIGFIVLFGVAVLNGLVLINVWNDLKKDTHLSLVSRITTGAKRRIRPILLTAGTDILGFLPMALSSSAGAEVQRPLATVVIGGMLSATILTLFILPILYRWVESKSTIRLGTITTVLVVAVVPLLSNAQVSEDPKAQVTLNEAIDKAQEKYPGFKATKVMVEKQEALKKTSWNLGKTGVFTAGEEIGPGDEGVETIIGVQQQNMSLFSGPSQRKLADSRIDLAKTEVELSALQIKFAVQNDFLGVFITEKRARLMQHIDSIYQVFEAAVEKKYRVSESSKLEYLSSTNRARKISIQKEEAVRDYMISLEKLNKWFMSDTTYLPDPKDSTWLEPLNDLTFEPKNHPELRRIEDQIAVSDRQISAQKAQALPQINFQYGLQTVDGASGFFQYQAGIAFPLIYNVQKGKVQAVKKEKEIVELEYTEQKVLIAHKRAVAEANYYKWLKSLNYYRDEALNLSEALLEGAQLSYQAGEIDYVSFLLNTHNALEIEMEALDALDNFLQAKFYLEYLMSE
jgi:cobalt-zinc-cadmium resistance protein CzcA